MARLATTAEIERPVRISRRGLEGMIVNLLTGELTMNVENAEELRNRLKSQIKRAKDAERSRVRVMDGLIILDQVRAIRENPTLRSGEIVQWEVEVISGYTYRLNGPLEVEMVMVKFAEYMRTKRAS